MAMVKYTAPIDELRGSIGGTTFSVNAMGKYARVRKKPRNPHSPHASLAISRVKHYSRLWAIDLTNPQRVAWNTLAANTTWQNPLGQNYNPTGFNLFVRASALLEISAQSNTKTAPASADEGTYTFTMDFLEAAGIRITSVGTLSGTDPGYIVTWVSNPLSQSIYGFHGPYHFLRTDLMVPVAPPYTWIPTADCERLRRYFFRFRIVRASSQASAEFFASVDVPVAP